MNEKTFEGYEQVRSPKIVDINRREFSSPFPISCETAVEYAGLFTDNELSIGRTVLLGYHLNSENDSCTCPHDDSIKKQITERIKNNFE